MSQRAMIAATVANMKEGRPEVIENNEKSTGQIRPVSEAKAAKLLKVGTTSVKAAKKVRAKGAPEVVAAVEKGELSVFEARIGQLLGPAENHGPATVHHDERLIPNRTDRHDFRLLARALNGECPIEALAAGAKRKGK